MVFLVVHRQIQHGKAAGGRLNWATKSHGGDPLTYIPAVDVRAGDGLPETPSPFPPHTPSNAT